MCNFKGWVIQICPNHGTFQHDQPVTNRLELSKLLFSDWVELISTGDHVPSPVLLNKYPHCLLLNSALLVVNLNLKTTNCPSMADFPATLFQAKFIIVASRISTAMLLNTHVGIQHPGVA